MLKGDVFYCFSLFQTKFNFLTNMVRGVAYKGMAMESFF